MDKTIFKAVFYTVYKRHNLFGLCVFAVQGKQKLPCGRCFRADVVDEIKVFLQDVNDLRVGFLLDPALDIVTVVIKAFAGIRAGNLNIGNCRQNHLQMMHLYFDVFGRQHGNVCRLNKEKQHFLFPDLQAVFRESLYPDKLLRGTAFFLILQNFTSSQIAAALI